MSRALADAPLTQVAPRDRQRSPGADDRGIARCELLVRKARADLRHRRPGSGDRHADEIQDAAHGLVPERPWQSLGIELADERNEFARGRHADARSGRSRCTKRRLAHDRARLLPHELWQVMRTESTLVAHAGTLPATEGLGSRARRPSLPRWHGWRRARPLRRGPEIDRARPGRPCRRPRSGRNARHCLLRAPPAAGRRSAMPAWAGTAPRMPARGPAEPPRA